MDHHETINATQFWAGMVMSLLVLLDARPQRPVSEAFGVYVLTLLSHLSAFPAAEPEPDPNPPAPSA